MSGPSLGHDMTAPGLASVPHLAPLCALVQRPQELEERLVGDLEDVFAANFMDLSQGSDCVGNHHGVAVSQQVLQAHHESSIALAPVTWSCQEFR